MNIRVRIKMRGKWYEAKRTGYPLDDYCETCPLRRCCNSESDMGQEVRRACDVFGYGFKLVKEPKK